MQDLGLAELPPTRVNAVLMRIRREAIVRAPGPVLSLRMRARMDDDRCRGPRLAKVDGDLDLSDAEGLMSLDTLDVLNRRDLVLPPAQSLTLCVPERDVPPGVPDACLRKTQTMGKYVRFAKAGTVTLSIRQTLTRLALHNVIEAEDDVTMLGINLSRLSGLRALALSSECPAGPRHRLRTGRTALLSWADALTKLPPSLEKLAMNDVVTFDTADDPNWNWLGRQRSLRRVCLRGASVAWLSRFGGVLHTRHLESLELSRFNLEFQGNASETRAVYDYLRDLPITKLVLHDTVMVHEPEADISRAFAGLSRLQRLDVFDVFCPYKRRERSRPQGWGSFSRDISLLTQLRYLRLCDSYLENSEWVQVLPGLGRLSALRSLDLACNGIKDSAWPAMLCMLCALRELEELDLAYNSLDFTSAAYTVADVPTATTAGVTADAAAGAEEAVTCMRGGMSDDAATRMGWLEMLSGSVPGRCTYVLPSLRRVDLTGLMSVKRVDQQRAVDTVSAVLLTRAPRLELVVFSREWEYELDEWAVLKAALQKAVPCELWLELEQCESARGWGGAWPSMAATHSASCAEL